MIVSVLKEIKNNKNRVVSTSAGLLTHVKVRREIYIESGVGSGNGFSELDYEAACAAIKSLASEV